MSLDADVSKLVKTGTVTISADGISVEGFSGEGCTCRDVAVQACLFAIGELQREVLKCIERPGGGNICID